MFKNIPLEKILSTAKSYGADFAELFAEETSTILLSHENKRIEKSIDGIDSGYGIRVVYNDKTSYGFTNDPNELTELARTIASAGHSGTANKTPNISISTPKIRETSRKKNGRDEKLSTAHKMIEEAARAAYLSPQISQVQITFRNLERRIWIANSDGLYACDDHPDTVMAVLAIAQNNGIVQTGFEPIGGSFDAEELLKDKKFDPVKLAKMSANRALMMLSAKMAPRGNMPVVISSSAGGTMIHEAVGHGLEADLAGQGMSVYKDKLGKNVASPLVTVIDDATLTKGRGSFTCDDEGHPSQKTVLIENGILKT